MIPLGAVVIVHRVRGRAQILVQIPAPALMAVVAEIPVAEVVVAIGN